MEPHPVPQNILDVEFKLFGAFSLRQFAKILISCLIGVGIYVIEPIPGIIRVIMIVAVVGVGVLTAIIPRFDVWVFGFIKALFISPRYVWIREYRTPEILESKNEASAIENKKVASYSNSKKISLDELSPGDIFSSKAKDSFGDDMASEAAFTAGMTDTQSKNFQRVYEDVFKGAKATENKTKSQIPPKTVQKPLAKAVVSKPSFKTIEEYQSEISRLKFELSQLNRGKKVSSSEQDILNRINELYAEIKYLSEEDKSKTGTAVQSRIVNNQTVITPQSANGVAIAGLIVDKKDNPVAGVKIEFFNVVTKDKKTFVSGKDGKFITDKIEAGDYQISLTSTSHKFFNYKITVGGTNATAYKFRER